MLPKVANHVLHTTARAVGAQQQTLWTALQSSGSGSGSHIASWTSVGSSNYGNAGAGAGGAKYHAGSRFYSGYTGAGRAVTQANSSGADSTTNGDDTDELAAHRHHLRGGPSARGRSPSVSHRLGQRSSTSPSVLKALQAHVREKHAFATSRPGELAASEPALSRNNSNLAVTLDDVLNLTPPPSPAGVAAVLYGSGSAQVGWLNKLTSASEHIVDAKNSGDREAIIQAVKTFRDGDNATDASVEDWTYALLAVYEARQAGESLKFLLETYNRMIACKHAPIYQTYRALILALCERDKEVSQVIAGIELHGSPKDGRRQARLARLRAEDNFSSAMSLFQGVSSLYPDRIDTKIYLHLLELCARHQAVDAALSVFSHLEERTHAKTPAVAYGSLMKTYGAAKDLAGVKDIFADFKSASAAGKLGYPTEEHAPRSPLAGNGRTSDARLQQLQVWNKAIEAHIIGGDSAGALALLEEMLDSNVGLQFGTADVPNPSMDTYRALIGAFAKTGDVETAMSWFERLLSQQASPASVTLPIKTPTRPGRQLWEDMVLCVSRAENAHLVDKLFDWYLKFAPIDGLANSASTVARLVEYQIVSLRKQKVAHEDQLARLNHIRHVVMPYMGEMVASSENARNVLHEMIDLYTLAGAENEAASLLLSWLQSWKAHIDRIHRAEELPFTRVSEMLDQLSATYESQVPKVMKHNTKLPIPLILDIAIFGSMLGRSYKIENRRSFFRHVPVAYLARRQEIDSLTQDQWQALLGLTATIKEETTPQVLEDAIKGGMSVEDLDVAVVLSVATAMTKTLGPEAALTSFKALGPAVESVFVPHVTSVPASPEITPESPASSVTAVDPIHIDGELTAICRQHENQPAQGIEKAVVASYRAFQDGLSKGVYPAAECLTRLMAPVARTIGLDAMREVYNAAEAVIATFPKDKARGAWSRLQDQAIIACALADDLPAAHLHRARLVQAGHPPSADAYGALIAALKETTDDAASALELFRDAKARGVRPTTFLYNNVIGKLAKARRVDYALELFHQMRADNVKQTNVTYGAIITACCKVGDVHSAETLFAEFVSLKFPPRAPPYNMMMQLYIQTRPDRERAMQIYHMMQEAGIQPTEHTYKLLLDAYGTIVPANLSALESTFEDLVADPKVKVTGVHWAALINAYGCVMKDVNRAIATFESIPTHPSTARSRTPLPDAVTWEALLGALVANRRSDLLPQYIERIRASGTHITAYVANAMIRGHAAARDLDAARAVFEAMQDPPVGVAAPNNHSSPKHPDSDMLGSAPSYREPSTWEAMVRVELGAGNRDRALALLERLKERHYPQAVYARIAGIMLADDTVSPWPSSA